jgi:hypothetical protein
MALFLKTNVVVILQLYLESYLHIFRPIFFGGNILHIIITLIPDHPGEGHQVGGQRLLQTQVDNQGWQAPAPEGDAGGRIGRALPGIDFTKLLFGQKLF